MSDIKVSVIVPVYNVEKYLDKCLNSLVNQTLEEIEIIVVNDGSKDNSQQIIDDYAFKYPAKVKPLFKENGGLSDARNYGMPYATGEYIGFIDSDDFVDTDMYEVMYKEAKAGDYQIVECNLHHTFNDYEDTEIGEHITDKKRLIMDGRSVVWNKIYKRDWLMNTGVTFHKGIIYEDVEFFVKLVPYMDRYANVEPAFVHYVQRNSSINNKSSLKTLDILTVLGELKNYYEEKGFYDEYRDALEYLFTRILLCSSMSRMCGIPDKKDRKSALNKNLDMLYSNFPEWRKNKYLKANHSAKGIFMKSINRCTYSIYSILIPIAWNVKARKKA